MQYASVVLTFSITEWVRLQFLHWPLEALQKRVSPIDPHVKNAQLYSRNKWREQNKVNGDILHPNILHTVTTSDIYTHYRHFELMMFCWGKPLIKRALLKDRFFCTFSGIVTSRLWLFRRFLHFLHLLFFLSLLLDFHLFFSPSRRPLLTLVFSPSSRSPLREPRRSRLQEPGVWKGPVSQAPGNSLTIRSLGSARAFVIIIIKPPDQHVP